MEKAGDKKAVYGKHDLPPNEPGSKVSDSQLKQKQWACTIALRNLVHNGFDVFDSKTLSCQRSKKS